jgi:hypothetical protein
MAGSRHRRRREQADAVAPSRHQLPGGSGGTSGAVNTGREGGDESAVEKPHSVVDLPPVEALDDDNPDVPAMWDGRKGYLFVKHPVIADQINYWVGEYPPSAAEQVRAEVTKWYRSR